LWNGAFTHRIGECPANHARLTMWVKNSFGMSGAFMPQHSGDGHGGSDLVRCWRERTLRGWHEPDRYS
jgi:hypothetical protein